MPLPIRIKSIKFGYNADRVNVIEQFIELLQIPHRYKIISNLKAENNNRP